MRYKVDNVEEVNEQNCQCACKVNVEIVNIEIVLMMLKLMIYYTK